MFTKKENLFVKDKFSEKEIYYSESEENKMRIVDFLRNGIDLKCSDMKLYNIGETGINSSNILLKNENQGYVIKIIRKNINCALLEEKLNMAETLRNNQIPFPKIYETNGRKIYNIEKEIWIITEYIEGKYFSGEYKEMAQACKLQALLNQCYSKINGYKNMERNSIQYDVNKMIEISKEAICYDRWDKINIKDRKKLIGALNILKKTIEEYKPRKEKTGYCYIDMHPHNLLYKNGNLQALLDFDSIMHIEDTEVAKAFNFFKLFRQYCVFNGLTTINDITNHMDEFLKLVGNESREDSLIRAIIEVGRRLLYITDSILKYGKSDWIGVIDIQSQLIIEANFLRSLK